MTAIAEYGSPAWQAERASYIGASDVPAIMNMSPYGSAHDVWMAKKHGVLPEVNAAMEIGHLLEPVAAELYRRRFPEVRLESCGTVAHPELPWLRATIDRLATTAYGQFPLEIKSTSAYLADTYGEEGSDQVPDHVFIQVQTQMLVRSFSTAQVAALIGGNDFRAPFVIEADHEIQERILYECDEFRTRYLEGDEEPEIGGPNIDAQIRRKYATHSDLMLTSASNFDVWLNDFAEQKRIIEEAEERRDAAKHAMQQFIGSNKGVISPLGKVTWSETKGRESIDAKGLVAHLNVPADVLQKFTKVGASFRTFRFTAAK